MPEAAALPKVRVTLCDANKLVPADKTVMNAEEIWTFWVAVTNTEG